MFWKSGESRIGKWIHKDRLVKRQKYGYSADFGTGR